jgi:tetratricopeptide (TPR) repeat protein
MGIKISRGFAAFVLSVALAAINVPAQTGSSAVVSVDALRHPMTPKVRQLLLSAMAKMDSGEHEAAIAELQDMLKKHPDSAAYVYNLLGVEYVKTDRIKDAISSFEQAELLLPHNAMTHYSFGLALICAGDYDRATEEVQRALELDPKNATMKAKLSALMEHNAHVSEMSSRSLTVAAQYR